LRKVEILQEVLPTGVDVSDFLRLIISAYNPLNPNGKRDFQRMMIVSGSFLGKNISKMKEALNEEFPNEEWRSDDQFCFCKLTAQLTGIQNATVYNSYTEEEAIEDENWILPEEVKTEDRVEVKNTALTSQDSLIKLFSLYPEIPSRGKNVLLENINTIGDLANNKKSELLELHGFSRGTLDPLIKIIKKGVAEGNLPNINYKFMV
jgi:hypothetical protein